ncbi:hypothetical protein CL622_00290 [archaeon]|nr:hypothetical protein [archaeon]
MVWAKLYIFLSNVRSSLLISLSGFLFLSIPILAFNGYFIGTAIQLSGKPVWLALLSLVPHGVFEIPALLFATGLGTLISVRWFHKPRNFKKSLKEMMPFYLKVILPLLFVAAIIEGGLIFFLR